MSDPMSNPNASLGKQAWDLEKAREFKRAAELYKQVCTARPDDEYAASGYMRCLRKLNKSGEAVEFGRHLSKELKTRGRVHQAWAWALYDYYFKQSENKEDDIFIDTEAKLPEDDHFKKMQSATEYVLKMSPQEDTIIRKQFIFGICREAKQRGKWQVVYKFAAQLNPEVLAQEPDEYSRMAEYERWLYSMIKSLFELERYDECLKMSQQGIDRYPQNKHFSWWHALSKARLNYLEDALTELQDLDKRYQEWFIRADIARIYEQLQQYKEAWIWYCKAAVLPGKLTGRYKMIGQMSSALQQHERWQEAYEHLQLACLLAEREHWDQSKMVSVFKGQIEQIKEYYTEQITIREYMSQDFLQLQRKLQKLWQNEVASSLPHRHGYIKTINEERKFGFIRSDTEDFYFKFHDLPRYVTPAINMEVEFNVEESFDITKQRNSVKAVHIQPITKHSSSPNGDI